MAMAADRSYSAKAASRGVFVRILIPIWTALYQHWRYRQTIKSLGRLDDRTLKDIGLTRTAAGEYMPLSRFD
ncbi:DUF1127 domain-containing protein [Roseibium sp.]|uniref:DUF1127 domain-containing protein n=1 Tax=Roseibium sp. TaxID=1936156 RepID=UPI003A9703C7